MEQIVKPKKYKKMVKAIIQSIRGDNNTIVLQPVLLGKNEEGKYVFCTIEQDNDDKDQILWIDYLKEDGTIYDSSDFDLSKYSDFSWVIKAILSKDFTAYNILFGAR